jgi:TetR/AcrR family transcriptional regulator
VPKPTFFNLPSDKRDRFVAVALEEFTDHPYDQASVSRIVARLGIAKGSVYQYFDDKYDLFAWLIAQSAEQRRARAAAHATGDVFADVAAAWVDGLSFAAAHPRWALLGLRLIEPSEEPRVVALRGQLDDAARGWWRERLAEAARAGAVRGDVDVALTAELANTLFGPGLVRVFARRLGLADDAAFARATVELSHPDARAAMLSVVSGALDLLTRGVGAAERPADRPPPVRA